MDLSTLSVQIGSAYGWNSARSNHTHHVFDSFQPVINQISGFGLTDFNRYPDPNVRGYLEQYLPKLVAVKCISIDFWQIRPSNLPGLVAQLQQLERLEISEDSDDQSPRDGFQPAVNADIISCCGSILQGIEISDVLNHDDPNGLEEDWLDSERDELRKKARARGIELYFVDDGWGDESANSWREDSDDGADISDAELRGDSDDDDESYE